ncbi:MAG: hypothetical protein IIA45_01985 [Bacteroidetes bacterium]|nr:hypothetical protein [Bacteroidota bacterium]
MKLIELESWFEDLRNLIIDLNISINNAKYLLTDGTETEENIKKHGFFQHHSFQLRFIIVIQLDKIFDNNSNQKRNIHKLFNKLKNEDYDHELTKKLKNNIGEYNPILSKEDLIERIQKLEKEIEVHTELIDRVKNARNKLYAHSDPEGTVQSLEWPNLENLVNLSAKIYNEIYGGLNSSQMLFEETRDWDVENIVKQLASYRDNKRN